MLYLYRLFFPAFSRCCLLAAAALTLALLCGPAAVAAEKTPPVRLPDYVVVLPSETHDNYILTQLFYAAFSADNIEVVQQVVRQGLLAAPKDFPRVMALTLELLKNPDSRLFMLLSPISWHMAEPATPTDIADMVHMANLLGGRILPGGARLEANPELLEARERELLRSRVRFYPEEGQIDAFFEEETAPEELELPELGTDKESLVFKRIPAEAGLPQDSTLSWSRQPLPDKRTVSVATDKHMGDGSTVGSVNRLTYNQPLPHTQNAFFVVRNGIITFAQPPALTEADFYADETAREHYLKEFETEVYNVQPDGSAPRPCQMEIQTVPVDAALPPELSVALQQTNPGPEYSDFLCRAQCRLTYSWNGQEYDLTGKSCDGAGQWGVWVYNPSLYEKITAPAGQTAKRPN